MMTNTANSLTASTPKTATQFSVAIVGGTPDDRSRVEQMMKDLIRERGEPKEIFLGGYEALEDSMEVLRENATTTVIILSNKSTEALNMEFAARKMGLEVIECLDGNGRSWR